MSSFNYNGKPEGSGLRWGGVKRTRPPVPPDSLLDAGNKHLFGYGRHQKPVRPALHPCRVKLRVHEPHNAVLARKGLHTYAPKTEISKTTDSDDQQQQLIRKAIKSHLRKRRRRSVAPRR